MLEIFSDSMEVKLSESVIGLLSSMPVPGGVRWKNGEAISNSLGISGRVVPMTDFPILFLVSDIISAVFVERAEEVVRLEDFRVGDRNNAVVVDETRRDTTMMLLNENIL